MKIREREHVDPIGKKYFKKLIDCHWIRTSVAWLQLSPFCSVPHIKLCNGLKQ